MRGKVFGLEQAGEGQSVSLGPGEGVAAECKHGGGAVASGLSSAQEGVEIPTCLPLPHLPPQPLHFTNKAQTGSAWSLLQGRPSSSRASALMEVRDGPAFHPASGT